MFEKALLDFLLAGPAVAAIVGELGSWGWRMQGSPTPAFTLIMTDGPRDVALDGATGFVDGYVQVDCWDKNANVTRQLAGALVKRAQAIDEAGTAGVIQAAFVEHDSGPEFEGEKPDRLFRSRLSLRVPFNEA